MGYKTAIYKPCFVNPLKSAFKFLILLGIVSLFADMTYEGARSITGPYLAILGASATVVGLVAGLGEFAGYGIRIIFGSLADCTGRYWTITIFGYFLNLLWNHCSLWQAIGKLAALLIIAERFGRRSVHQPVMSCFRMCEGDRNWMGIWYS